MTNYVWINTTLYATATVMETVYHLCAPTTIPWTPTPPGGDLGQKPIVTIVEPLPGTTSNTSLVPPVTSSVTILEHEADYAKDKTAVVVTFSTTLPLPITRTETIEANPTPGRAMKMSCALDGKLTYHFLHGYDWDVSIFPPLYHIYLANSHLYSSECRKNRNTRSKCD